MQDTLRDELQKKPKKKAGFATGLITGLVLATVLSVFVFLALYPVMYANHVSAEESETDAIINSEAEEKINLIDQTIRENYYKDDVDVEAKRTEIYRGLVRSLGDVYSVYYTAEEYAELMQQNEGIYYGIGAYVSFNEELMRAYVSGVIPGSPAEEAELKENDIIWTVNGESTEGLQTDQVASMIRGPEGTQVVVGIRRDGEDMEFTLTRRKVEHQTVTGRMLDDNIGYLQLSGFEDVTHGQFLEVYQDLQNQGMQAMVLDLRGNPGGLLSSVVRIAGEILPKGEIVYTIDKYGNREAHTSDGKNEIQIPLAVLINGSSASASEILSGAIKDYDKGTLVGTTTFGKGIVQRTFPFEDDSAVKLTISDYYTPDGNNIHGVGIEPDVVIEFDAEAYEKDETDNQLDKAVEILKKQMQ